MAADAPTMPARVHAIKGCGGVAEMVDVIALPGVMLKDGNGRIYERVMFGDDRWSSGGRP